MALAQCSRCGLVFFASCGDGSCLPGLLCAHCIYEDVAEGEDEGDGRRDRGGAGAPERAG